MAVDETRPVDDDAFADAVKEIDAAARGGAPTQPTTEEIAAELSLRTGVDSTEVVPAPAWTALNPMLAFEAGKAGVQLEREATIEIMLAEQAVTYNDPRTTREQLVQALLDRDRIIAQFGREIANGKMGGRLLREFVRAALADADRAQDPQKLQEFLEKALGAEKADARQLRIKGTTL